MFIRHVFFPEITDNLKYYMYHTTIHVRVLLIMKRTFKRWYSTIPSISAKQTITSHLNSLNTTKTITNVGHTKGKRSDFLKKKPNNTSY
jgi:hypothetical protein